MSGSTETPPPFDVDRTLSEIARYQEVVASWDATQALTVSAYKQSIEALHTEVFRRMIRTFKTNETAMALLKQAVEDDLVYSVLRHHGIIKPSIHERVETALQSVRPMLATHGGNVELVRIVPPGTVEVRFIGACDSCPASALTFHSGVKKAIQDHCPDVTDVIHVKGIASATADAANSVRFISPFSLPNENNWLPVCNMADIPEEGALFTEAGGQPIILCKTMHGFACYQNACAHMGMKMDGGTIQEGILQCPSHGFRYDLSSGECLTAPEVQLQVHAVRVVGNRVEVRLMG